MEHSLVYRRIYFLKELGNTRVRYRKIMIQSINVQQMAALAKIVQFMLNGSLSILQRDYRIFRRYINMLRQLISPSISLTRKRNSLLRHHDLLPRILREYYLNQTIIIEIQNADE